MQKSLIINPDIIIFLNGKVNNTLHIYVYETHKADPDEQYESGLTVSTAHLSFFLRVTAGFYHVQWIQVNSKLSFGTIMHF